MLISHKEVSNTLIFITTFFKQTNIPLTPYTNFFSFYLIIFLLMQEMEDYL